MPREVGSELGISVIGTSPFRPFSGELRRAETEKEKSSAQLTLNHEVAKTEASTQAEVNDVKFPVVARTAALTSEENNDLEILLRVRCFDFPLQVHGLMPEANKSNEKSKNIEPERSQVDRDQKNGKTSEGDDESDNLEGMNLPDCSTISSLTVLEGQRVNLREKDELRKRQHKQPRCQPTKTDSTEARRKSLPKLVSSKPKRQDTRPVFHLPKVDKYDIIHKNIIDVKVCSVFKVNDLKSSLIYSGYKDSWVPHRDRNFMKNSVFFKALMQKPTVLLKQTSCRLAEESIAAAIQSVEETSAGSPSVDAEVTRQEKKFVIRLPPVC
ncbi:uncharacterized protein LOC144645675 [Oculina patagonica]